MKKYIRTKDKVYRVSDNLTEESIKLAMGDNCLKVGDTIEELCDWFIVEGDDNEITYHKTLFSAETDGKDYILESNETYTIYGCILVKGKALKYVAKMNDKGELELL